MTEIVLKKITHCNLEEQLSVLKIRNLPSVRKEVYSDKVISDDEHLKWIENLKTNSKIVNFVIFKNGEICGSISAIEIDSTHQTCKWSFYLDEKSRQGISVPIELFFIDYVFNDLQMQKLNCDILETNELTIQLHKKFGFKEEGYLRSQLIRNHKRIGVFLLGLTSSDWLYQRELLLNNYKIIFKKFKVQFYF